MKAYLLTVFSGEQAAGNPAGVVVLDDWLDTATLQQIARQLAQPVTTFVVHDESQYAVRWFSQQAEINLCGHGSLAAAAVLLEFGEQAFGDAGTETEVAADVETAAEANTMTLTSEHGTVIVRKDGARYHMTLPGWQPNRSPDLKRYLKQIGLPVIDSFATRDLVLVAESPALVRQFTPDMAVLAAIADYHAVILTAQDGSDGYVLRYFAPKIGIDEDIATGSAQCSLALYWLEQLGRETLKVTQLSAQGGAFVVRQQGEGHISLQVEVRLVSVLNLP
ncbi:PhzF family phenazine biosynthesis protein [Photobacterium atrarenae]|uniref:PhzF family phenazine biosynthesis protein n=1 Tax=Photobacterium atrarenae TaxID=865757 RepID=A0ABY5GMF7_9GAMM|nr:PhzF family phenazine biosynthesis protein [Photobacterium atrarenae]UTV30284.1 PhzF family phenazine biosynthesis protein [Photobacterium atrarenae]